MQDYLILLLYIAEMSKYERAFTKQGWLSTTQNKGLHLHFYSCVWKIQLIFKQYKIRDTNMSSQNFMCIFWLLKT